MKSERKNILTFISVIVSFVSVFAQQTPSSGYHCTPGIYHTYDDFLKGNLDYVGSFTRINSKEIVFTKPDSTMTIGPQEFIFKWDDSKIWGWRKMDGNIYRIDQINHEIYTLVTIGAYYLWTTGAIVGRNEKGEVNWIQIQFNLDYAAERFSKHLFISKDGNSPLINCSNNNLKMLFKDEPEILTELSANPIKERDQKTLQVSCDNVFKWVAMHNAKH